MIIAVLLAGVGHRPGAAQDAHALQRRVVADLTGWTDSTGQTSPFSRSTPTERAAAADYLFRTLREHGLDAGRHRYKWPNANGLIDLLVPPYVGTNIVAEVKATTRSEEYVVLGAHYDSEFRSPGAIDNASGVAVVLATAFEVAKLASRSRNFLFVFFDQEEDDEIGSRAFARRLVNEGVEVHSVHVVDLAAWDPNGDRTVVIESPPLDVDSLYADVARALAIPVERVAGGGASSDNKSFMALGLPTVGVFQDEVHPQIHRDTDTFEIVNFEYLSLMTSLVSAVMIRLAGQ